MIVEWGVTIVETAVLLLLTVLFFYLTTFKLSTKVVSGVVLILMLIQLNENTMLIFSAYHVFALTYDRK